MLIELLNDPELIEQDVGIGASCGRGASGNVDVPGRKLHRLKITREIRKLIPSAGASSERSSSVGVSMLSPSALPMSPTAAPPPMFWRQPLQVRCFFLKIHVRGS